jgi:hypothetical protein
MIRAIHARQGQFPVVINVDSKEMLRVVIWLLMIVPVVGCVAGVEGGKFQKASLPRTLNDGWVPDAR